MDGCGRRKYMENKIWLILICQKDTRMGNLTTTCRSEYIILTWKTFIILFFRSFCLLSKESEDRDLVPSSTDTGYLSRDCCPAALHVTAVLELVSWLKYTQEHLNPLERCCNNVTTLTVIPLS